MKWLLLIIAAIVMVVLLVLGGGFAWLMNIKTDVNDPAFAEKFQKTMEGACFKRAKGMIAGAGSALDYQQEALVKQVCACDAKAITKILAKRKADTPVEMQKAINDSAEEMDAAFQSCAAAYGVP